ncbi:unnamed protein product, partial [Mycena citricolor]
MDALCPPQPGLNLAALEVGIGRINRHLAKVRQLQARFQVASNAHKEAAAQSLIHQAMLKLDEIWNDAMTVKQSWENASASIKPSRNDLEDITFETGHYHEPLFRDVAVWMQMIFYLIVVCSTLLHISRRGCLWVMMSTQDIVRRGLGTSNSPALQEFRDVPTMQEHFNLDTAYTIHASCPACHHTHRPEGEGPGMIYPSICVKRDRQGRKCNTPLLQPRHAYGRETTVPIRPFIEFHFVDWLARFLAHPGNEKKMDKSWDRLNAEPVDLTDVLDGSFVRNFKGPDKAHHFSVPSEDGEGRYIFSLNFDFFNPLGARQSGKKISVGAFSLVCLNLPIEERYRTENMFLCGIIPGPNEPPLDATNSYFAPLVDCFVRLWHCGVRFTETCEYALGRLVRCAIVAFVCDLPAARKISGFASASHTHFCTVCKCTRDTVEERKAAQGDKAANQYTGRGVGYNDIRVDDWPLRMDGEWQAAAQAYRNAAHPTQAQACFNSSGVRTSEFLRLPYFEPTKMIVVDPMHNLFLGLLHETFRRVLGFSEKANDGPAVHRLSISLSPTDFLISEKDAGQVQDAIRFLETISNAELEYDDDEAELHRKLINLSKSALVHVARGLGCPTEREVPALLNSLHQSSKKALSKAKLVDELISWRRKQVETVPSRDDGRLEIGHVITKGEMKALWADIAAMHTPSWVSSVPRNYGSAQHGKLKADQWRALAMVYIPVTLIRLWSDSTLQRQGLLDMTMHLIAAVDLASSRKMIQGNDAKVQNHLLKYRTALHACFPEYTAHPNHHLALHIPHFLRLFGPVHGWWAYPFERMNGKMLRIKTNYKPGEYEITIGRRYQQMANVYRLESSAVFPVANELKLRFDQIFRGVSATKSGGSKHPVTLKDCASAFHRSKITLPLANRTFSNVKYKGLSYSTRHKHRGNSSVYYTTGGTRQPLAIEHIIQSLVGAEPVYVVCRPYRPVCLLQDPFLKYPDFGGKIWSRDLEADDKGVVLTLEQIEGHFASCDMKGL